MSFKRSRRSAFVMTVLGTFIVFMFMASANMGYKWMPPADIVKTLLGYGTAKQELVLLEFRLPRIVLAILVGAGLAVSGAVLQAVTRNPLADPAILGITSGAGLGVNLYVVSGLMGTFSSIFALPVVAMLGAFATAAALYILSYKRGEGIRPIRIVLVGVALAAGINAAMMVLATMMNSNEYQFVYTWLAGTLWATNWQYVLALLPWIVILIPLMMLYARHLNIITLTEQVAIGLGTAVERTRQTLIAAAVALAAACVAVGGGIGFVGLLAPHLTRRLIGPQHQYLIPASAMTGALLVLAADAIGRVILGATEVSAGIVVAIIGAPYFIYLLLRTR
ncbi:FecCD family ABC transporter permease [Paenibacillus tarimensis]|uniref:FecCD family ABC transporter permease n=1 Tax=Paenibacillus tarimensis TaxID=416012 RepID=UPI001F2DB86F|nr:iron ABC transporter permease [Paenibacillus tarimensis]MCF2943572.1 iron ABC transporter permease [Paenibacillus tarimensis]